MRRCGRVVRLTWRQVTLRGPRCESFIEALDGNLCPSVKIGDETLGSAGLSSPFASERERHTNDDASRFLSRGNFEDTCQSGVGRSLLDDLERSCQRARWIRYRKSGSRLPVIDRKHPHLRTAPTI